MKTLYRILIYLSGLLILAFGIVFSINSHLGVSPASSLPHTISKISNIQMGYCVMAVYCMFVLAQLLVLGKNFKIINILQLVFAVVFGYFVNFTSWVLGDFAFPTYAGRLAMIGISIILIALGLAFYLSADIVPMPIEGFAAVLSRVFPKISFPTAKVIIDCTCVLLAVVIALIFTGSIIDIREGTIITAVLAGRLMGFFAKLLRPKLQAFWIKGNQEPSALAK